MPEVGLLQPTKGFCLTTPAAVTVVSAQSRQSQKTTSGSLASLAQCNGSGLGGIATGVAETRVRAFVKEVGSGLGL